MARELRKRKGQPETTLPAGAEAQNDDPVPDASSESEASFSDSDSTSGEEEEEAKDDCMEQPAKRRRRKVQRAGGVKSSAYTGRRFQCPECPKSFRLEIHLQAHTRIHTGERKFQCKFPGCPYWAQHKSVLVSHERTHTGEKPYKCSFAGCTFAFTQDAPLKAHERRHTGEKPYFCGIEGCAYRGIQRTSLLDHVTRLHPQNVLKDAMGKQKTVVDPSQPRVDLLAGQTVFVKKGPPRNKLTTKPPHTKVSASSAPSEVAAILRTDEVMSEEPEAPEQPGMTEEEAREIVANLKLGPAQIGTRIYKALYTCPLDDCEYTCRLTEKMFDHLRLHGRNPEPHLCGIGGCPVRTRSRPQMEVHVKKEHSGRGLHETQMMKLRYACTVEGCTASFRKNAVLAFHLRDQHDLGHGHNFSDLTSLNSVGKVLIKNQAKPLNRISASVFIWADPLLVNFVTSGPFICGIQGCGDVLESPASLRAHVQSRHPGHTVDDTLKARLGESVNQYTVAELSEKYALGKVLRCSFAQKFATAKGYTTPCPFTCTDKVRLDEHKKLVHGGKTPYLCGIGGCLYRCKDSSRLKVHVKSLHPKADYEKDAVKREFLGSTFLMPDASSEQNLAKTDAIHERVGSSTTTQNESSEDLCEMDDQSEVSTKDLGFDKLLVEILAVKPPSPFKALPQADDVKDTESCGADFVMDETEDVMEQDVDGIEHTVNGLPSVVAPVELDVSQPIVLPVIQAEDVATSPQVYLVGLDDAGSAGRFQMKVTGMTRCSVPMSKGGMQQMGYFVTFEDFEGLERHLPAGLVSSSASKNFTVSF